LSARSFNLPVGGEPEGVTMSLTVGSCITSEEDNISVIDTRTSNGLTQFAGGPRPRASEFTPDGTRAYVTSENGSVVSVVDTRTHTHQDDYADRRESRPMGLWSPDGRRPGQLAAVAPWQQLTPLPRTQGLSRWASGCGIAISPDGKYLRRTDSNDVSVVDVATMAVTATVKAGDRPGGGGEINFGG
jgi:YVTN family beta-propeller protein